MTEEQGKQLLVLMSEMILEQRLMRVEQQETNRRLESLERRIESIEHRIESIEYTRYGNCAVMFQRLSASFSTMNGGLKP